MDVHDCSSVSKSQPLRPGNIVTIEPGVYIPLTDSREMADSFTLMIQYRIVYIFCLKLKLSLQLLRSSFLSKEAASAKRR